MKIDDNINYSNPLEVSKIISDIDLAIKLNGVTKGKICQIVGIGISTYSHFKAQKKPYVTEKRIKLLVSAVNYYHREDL